MPRSVRVALAPGKGIPWSVVQMTRVSSLRPRASSSSSTAPMPASRERALALKAAMSRRISGVSGRCAGTAAQRSSPSAGRKNSRWVSKKPTDRKNGRRWARRSRSMVTGATSVARVVAILTTSS